jgi:adenylate cyclase
MVMALAIPIAIRAGADRVPPDSLKVDLGHRVVTMRDVSTFLKQRDMPEFFTHFQPAELIGWAIVLLLLMLLIPAVISAASKLGELAMEPIHPLDLALERVGAGDLDVAVEEGGSVEFQRLSAQFNRMVASLDLARRMERAFGAYVSQPIIDRIRAQRGASELPAVDREATVFFADVRGFTAMSEPLPPDRLLAVLNRYYGHVIEVVESFEGYIDKFIGDAIYVVFNGPIDQPDHAVRGTRCAIALQEKIIALSTEGAYPEVGRLDIGVGVATGPVVAGSLGNRRMQYTIIGDTVNLASRLSQHAHPGEVLVNGTTARALPADLRDTALEPIAVKGKAKPVEVHRVFPRSPSATLDDDEAVRAR